MYNTFVAGSLVIIVALMVVNGNEDCSTFANAMQCQLQTSCTWKTKKLCKLKGGKRLCQSFVYGCVNPSSFCEYSSGTAAQRMRQCQGESACRFNSMTRKCELIPPSPSPSIAPSTARPSSHPTLFEQCTNTCKFANDGQCDDGGPQSLTSVCNIGTDCADCGGRTLGVMDSYTLYPTISTMSG